MSNNNNYNFDNKKYDFYYTHLEKMKKVNKIAKSIKSSDLISDFEMKKTSPVNIRDQYLKKDSFDQEFTLPFLPKNKHEYVNKDSESFFRNTTGILKKDYQFFDRTNSEKLDSLNYISKEKSKNYYSSKNEVKKEYTYNNYDSNNYIDDEIYRGSIVKLDAKILDKSQEEKYAYFYKDRRNKLKELKRIQNRYQKEYLDSNKYDNNKNMTKGFNKDVSISKNIKDKNDNVNQKIYDNYLIIDNSNSPMKSIDTYKYDNKNKITDSYSSAILLTRYILTNDDGILSHSLNKIISEEIDDATIIEYIKINIDELTTLKFLFKDLLKTKRAFKDQYNMYYLLEDVEIEINEDLYLEYKSYQWFENLYNEIIHLQDQIKNISNNNE